MPTKKILEKEDIQAIKPNFEVLNLWTKEQALESEIFFFNQKDNTYFAITTNKFTDQIRGLVAEYEKLYQKVEIYYTDDEGFAQAMKRYDTKNQLEKQQFDQIQYEQKAQGKTAIQTIRDLFDKKDTMEAGEFVVEIIRLGFQAGASDIHFQSEEKQIILRLRIDGVLHNILNFTHSDFYRYSKKIKFLANTKMNVEHIPQDGRFSIQAIGSDGQIQNIDVRASFIPGIKSESIVLRYLDSAKSIQNFEDLGFEPIVLKKFKKALESNTGLVLITGPTGSGKTTTLYSILDSKNDGSKKIITLEDPIEYKISGIQQSQIEYRKGYDYPMGLNACLRHDPDIILVGETRAIETAETVINAALTGHLVFTTIHTNNAIEAINRLVSMGIQSYMLAPSLVMIQAQRLVRKLCPHCKIRRKAETRECDQINQNIQNIKKNNPDDFSTLSFDGQVWDSKGCDHCDGLGYKGRIAVMEILVINNDIREAISSHKSEKEILNIASQSGYITILQDAVLKLLQGTTSLEEINRVL